MRVLFIGGTGLISTAIARELLESGHHVTLFNRGKSESRLPAGAELILGDRKDYAAFERTFSDKSYDVVVDMVSFQPSDAESAIRAFQGRVGQFLHCSTVCVYSGPVTQIPTTETEPFHSIGGYGKNKARCEQTLLRAFEAHGFPVTILRPSHSYGEGGDILRAWDSWNNAFIQRMSQGRPIVVPGDGTGLWASCHVDDVAHGFIATMGNDKCLGQAYHITGDEWMTWNDYHRQIAEVSGGVYHPVHIPSDILLKIAPRKSEPNNEIFAWTSIFDNAKLKRDTSYPGQTVSFRHGMERTLKWLERGGKLKTSEAGDYEDRLIEAWNAGVGTLPHEE